MIRPVPKKNLGTSPSSFRRIFRRDQHEKAWASPNTFARVLACILHAEAARMARCPLLARVLHSKKTRTARCPSARRKTAKTKNSSAYRACVRLPACAGTGFIRSRSRLLQGLAAHNRRGRRPASGGLHCFFFFAGDSRSLSFGVAITVNGSQSRCYSRR